MKIPVEKIIKDQEFGGERPLYGERNLRIEHVTIHAGESALKECENIEADRCRFEGKYPFWHCNRFVVYNSFFTEGARAALWYSEELEMTDTRVEAPKMFRDSRGITLERVVLPNAQETFWHCSEVTLKAVEVDKADYLFMHSAGVRIENYRQQGNYSFQYCRNVEIRNAEIHSKDAFWNTEDVTVYDSTLDGEYLGWYSKRLRLVNCRISGTQPLCYAEDLVLENCSFGEDADLAFEYSSVQATIRGTVPSVKNPNAGSIVADGYGEIIRDEYLREGADCRIEVRETQKA